MIKFFLTILACLWLVAPASATIYELTATAAWTPVVQTFSLQYNDLNNNGRFSLDELISGTFSGTYVSISGGPWTYASTILGVPLYSVADGRLLTDGPPYTPEAWNDWTFVLPNGDGLGHPGPIVTGWSYGDWTYGQTVVPLPPSALLFGSGFLGLAGWRRFRKS
jgi:hypothetical protein